MIDPRGPVSTVIGSRRDELINGNYSIDRYSGYTPNNMTIVGGYGNDGLWGADGNDSLYGDLPLEIEGDQAAINRSGNGIGSAGKDYLNGGKGNDTLVGGGEYDTYYYN